LTIPHTYVHAISKTIEVNYYASSSMEVGVDQA